MKFEIKVENKGEFQKLLLLRCLHLIFGITIPDAREIVDRIEELHTIGGVNSSVIIDSGKIVMSPMFKTEKPNPVFTHKDLGVEVNIVERDDAHLDLCKLLENCIGMKFYMPHFGKVTLDYVAESDKAMRFKDSKSNPHIVLCNGCSSTGEEVCIFPSKEQRDWSLFAPPWIPKEGERVWMKNKNSILWDCGYFQKRNKDNNRYICHNQGVIIDIEFDECVPFEPIPW